MKPLYFLKDDYDALNNLIAGRGAEVKEIGREQGIAAAQGSEGMGHDDAPQEVLTYQRQVAVGHAAELTPILRRARVHTRLKKYNDVRFGAIVELKKDGQRIRYQIGSYMVLTNHEPRRISYNSDLAKAMIGKEEGEIFEFRGSTYEIIEIS